VLRLSLIHSSIVSHELMIPQKNIYILLSSIPSSHSSLSLSLSHYFVAVVVIVVVVVVSRIAVAAPPLCLCVFSICVLVFVVRTSVVASLCVQVCVFVSGCVFQLLKFLLPF
jgi:hypothetical protein